MPDEKPARTLWTDLFSFEQRLRSGSRRAMPGTRDTELVGVLERVALRRHSRRGAPTAGPRTPASLVAVGEQVSASGAPGAVLAVTRLAAHVAILRLGKPAGFRFQPGQHIKLGIANGPTNPYTISSAPSDPHLEFCIEAIPGGRVAPRLIALSPGARVA